MIDLYIGSGGRHTERAYYYWFICVGFRGSRPTQPTILGQIGIYVGSVHNSRINPYRRGEVSSPIDQRGFEPQIIKVESIVGLYSYLDPKTSILENGPTAVRNRLSRVTKGLGDPTPTKSAASVSHP